MYSDFNKGQKSLLIKLENRSNYLLKYKYKTDKTFMNRKAMNEILYNKRAYTSLLFKEFIITEEVEDALKKYYPKDISLFKLNIIISYYSTHSQVFPCLSPLWENKYLSQNLLNKQRIIDDQEKVLFNHSVNKNDDDDLLNVDKNIFNNEVLNSIFKEEISKQFDGEDPDNNLNNSIFSIENLIDEIDFAERLEKKKRLSFLAEKIKKPNDKIQSEIKILIRNSPKRKEILIENQLLSNSLKSDDDKLININLLNIKEFPGKRTSKKISTIRKTKLTSKENKIHINSLLKIDSTLNTLRNNIKFKKTEEFIQSQKLNKLKQIKRAKILEETVIKIKEAQYKNKTNPKKKLLIPMIQTKPEGRLKTPENVLPNHSYHNDSKPPKISNHPPKLVLNFELNSRNLVKSQVRIASDTKHNNLLIPSNKKESSVSFKNYRNYCDSTTDLKSGYSSITSNQNIIVTDSPYDSTQSKGSNIESFRYNHQEPKTNKSSQRQKSLFHKFKFNDINSKINFTSELEKTAIEFAKRRIKKTYI